MRRLLAFVLALTLALPTPLSVALADNVVRKDYRALTNTQRGFTNFNVEVVRGFVVDPETLDVYAVNAYESTVVHHLGLAGIQARWRTVSNPVSIAFYDGDLLVVGQGNHTLVRHDRATGRIVDLLMLRSEPADIVVDADNDQAFISLMGDDSVLQVRLAPSLAIVKRWSWDDGLLLKRPRFLALDRGDLENPKDNAVYVAPLISGNNTLIHKIVTLPFVFDGNDPALFPQGGLPDVDLFRIRPAAGAVDPVLRQVGSILTAHGPNPVTGDYWMLNVDHNNAVPGMLSEPSVRGKFADNVLSITAQGSFPAPNQPTGQPTTYVDLDNITPGGGPTYVPTRSVSFPYAMAFEAQTGWAAIGSSTTPNVVLVDPSGIRQFDMSLANPGLGIDGRVVRTVDFLGSNFLLAYCQQSGEILVWTLSPFNTVPTARLTLGNDPTPAPVARGRGIWYDAVPSLDGRSTCNSCHPQGGADALVWQISNRPVDEKGPMVTQTLLGIEDTFPYHWRGERALEDFNVAFSGLLGAAQDLDENNGELDDFMEFVFSLRPAANPLQVGVFDPAQPNAAMDYDRQLKDAFTPWPQTNGEIPSPLVGDPTAGDDVFHDDNSDGVLGVGTCTACHSDPTGTNGDFFADVPNQIASLSNFDVTQLDNQLSLKNQPLTTLQTLAGPLSINLLGSGTLHTGQVINLFDFNNIFFSGLGPQKVADLTAFVQLFDTGTAPSVHFAARLAQGSPAATSTAINRWLLQQAAKGWVGCAVIGTFPVSGTPTPMHWFYNPRTNRFVPERPDLLAPQPLSQFVTFAQQGLADNVFLGVPPGNERRLGVDFDDDGLDTAGEIAAGTDRWNPDFDGDGWPDGYEVANGSLPTSAGSVPVDVTPPALSGPITVDFVNASQAKLFFATNEPASWQITVNTPGGQPVTDSRLTQDTRHTALIHDLEPSTLLLGVNKVNTYSGNLILTDLQGNNSAPIPIPDFDTLTLIHGGNLRNTVVGRLALSNEQRTATTYGAQADLRIDFREQGPPAIAAADEVVVAQLLKQAANGKDWDVVPAADITHNAPATDFLLNGAPYAGGANRLPGPFLVLSPTNGTGDASVTFTVANLTAGQKVLFNVLAVIPAEPGHNPASPSFSAAVLTPYQMPATKPENRGAESTI